MGVELGSAYGKIVIDASGVTSGLNAAKGALSGFQDSIGGMGQTLKTKVTLPLLNVGTVTAKTVGDFESEMNVLEIAARDSGTSLEELRQAAITAGADTQLVGISASEAAEALTGFYKAGLDTTAIFGDLNRYLEEGTNLTGALRAAVDLAAASDLDLAQASDTVAVAMATYGLGAEEAVGIADSFVQAADASVAEVSELAAAMVNVGPTAAQFGWSLEDVNAALGLLSERGITGSEAGTALKSMMTNLMRPTDAVAGRLGELNVALYNADGTMKSLPEIIGQLEHGLEGLADEERNLAIQTLAGTYGMKAMAVLLGEGSEGWRDMEEAMKNAASAQETAAARTKGFNASMEQLSGALETLMIDVGTPLIEEFLTPLIEKLTELLGWVMEQDRAWINAALAIAGVVAVAGPLLMGLGAIASGISALISVIGVLGGAIAAVAGVFGSALLPVLLIVVGVVGLLYVAWKENLLGIRDIAEQVWQGIQVVFQFIKEAVENLLAFFRGEISWDEAVAGIVDAWDDLVDDLGEIWAKIKQMVGRVLESIKNLVIEKMAGFIAPLVGGMDDARRIVVEAWQNVLEFLAGVWENLKMTVAATWDWIKARVVEAVETIRAIVATVLQLLSGDWAGAWETMRAAVVEKWDTIRSGIAEVIEVIGGLIAEGWGRIVGVVTEAAERIKGVITGAWESVRDLWARLKGAEAPEIVDPGQAAEQTTIWKGMIEALRLAWQTMQVTVTEIANELREFLDLWATDLEAMLAATWERMLETVRKQWEAIRSAVVKAAEAMRSRVVSIVRDMVRQVISQFNQLRSAANDAGRAVGRALADGLRSQVGAVRAAARELADAIASQLPGSDAEEGPLSRLTASGMALPQTLAEGIEAGRASLVQAVEGMAEVMAAMPLATEVAAVTTPMASAGAGRTDKSTYPSGPAQVTINIERVGDDVDVQDLAYQIAEVLNLRKRGR